ncbi:unnamed protein product, partial [Rotaria socialis]
STDKDEPDAMCFEDPLEGTCLSDVFVKRGSSRSSSLEEPCFKLEGLFTSCEELLFFDEDSPTDCNDDCSPSESYRRRVDCCFCEAIHDE